MKIFKIKFLNVLICLLTISSIRLHSQTPEIIWQHSYGGSLNDQANAIRPTADHGFIVAGYTKSTDGDVLYNHGYYDYWLLKLDSLGIIEWQKSYGGSAYDYCYNVQVTSDGGYILAGIAKSTDGDVTGNHGDDYWIVKTDETGNIEWQKCYGGSNSDYAYSVVQTEEGGYIVVGISGSDDGDVSGHHGGSNNDYWVVKINSVGEIEWEKSLGSNGTEYGNSIIQTEEGGYLVAGSSDPNGGGGDVTGNHGSADYWIVKLGNDGELQWQKSFGGSETEEAYAILETEDKGFIVTSGHTYSNSGEVSGFHGGTDAWIIKIDSIGNLEWQKCYGGTEFETGYDLIKLSDNNFVFAGLAESDDGDLTENKGYSDVWVVKFDTLGNIIWQKSIGGSLSDYAFSVIESFDGNYVLAGISRSSDYDATVNHGDFDYWIVKLGFCNTHYYADADGDGFGNLLIDSVACNLPIGFVLDSTDCDDANNLIHPFTEDICNSIDDNCNGEIDEDALFVTQYADADGDGFGDIVNDSLSCFELPGYVLDSADCNDLNTLINPASPEICNGMDDNCNADIDEGLTIYTFYADADGDGFGDADTIISSCLEIIPGYVSDSTDCDDTNNLIYPGAEEICNYMDDDCDGIIDDNLTYIHSYQDADGDDFGNIEIDSLACTIPFGYVADDSDCDDTNPNIYPGALELLNGLDDDCDGLTDENLAINNTLLNEIKIYPNPAETILHIEYSGNEKVEIEILNPAGQIIYSNQFSLQTEIDINKYAAGIYFIKFNNDEGNAGLKFVKL